MGLFFRKTKKLGLLNLNLSKSGVGFSVGVKGLRLGLNSRGTYLNAGRDGIYYRKSLNSSARVEYENIPAQCAEKTEKLQHYCYSEIELTGEKKNIQDICVTVNKKIKYQQIGCLTLIILAFIKYPYGFILALLCSLFYAIVNFCLLTFKEDITTSCLDRESELQEKYNYFVKAFSEYTASCTINMGTSTTGTCGELPLFCKMSNKDLKLPTFKINFDKYMFGPDFVIEYKKGKYSAYSYTDYHQTITLNTVHIKTTQLFADEKIIETIYKHTKKDGTPDLRYKNDAIYITEFTQFSFLGENWLCSNKNVINELINSFKLLNPEFIIRDLRNEEPTQLDYTNEI